MPIWLRTFTFNKLKEFYENQNKESEPKSNSKKIYSPDISPSYSTKASKN